MSRETIVRRAELRPQAGSFRSWRARCRLLGSADGKKLLESLVDAAAQLAPNVVTAA